jgi:hypothetical protein
MDVLKSCVRFIAVILTCSNTAAFAAVLRQATPIVPTNEYQLKAAYFVNFARYIEWPADAFESAASPLTLCILEPNPFGDALTRLVADQAIQNRRIDVHVVANSTEAKSCHLLFVSTRQQANSAAILSQLDAFPIVTVGVVPTFTASGGAIELVTVGGRIRFEINLSAVERRGIRVSSRLLGLARAVHK